MLFLVLYLVLDLVNKYLCERLCTFLLQSIPLWLHHLEFVEERDMDVAECTEAGIAKMRALFERALTATGLHFTEGGKVWEAYRDYEAALLVSMAESPAEVIHHFFLSFIVICLTRK